MKKTLLIACIAFAGAAQAQLVQTGFEAWTDGTPDGWGGSKTHTSGLTVTQVTENVHGGTSALGLTMTGVSHRRFTTQSVTVENAVEYTVTYWVRGTGRIRAGLFDNRPAQSGYVYAPYVDATPEWTEIQQTVMAAKDTTGAEFIFSVQASGDGVTAEVAVDDVTITDAGTVQPVSIHDIQFTSDPSGASPLMDQQVFTGGIISAVDLLTSGNNPVAQKVYYLQDASAPWSGIYVYDFPNSTNNPVIGDSITISATVTEYFGLTELSQITSYTVVQSGLTPHAPLMIETGEVASEALESVLVQVVDATCTEVPGGANFGKWSADDGSGVAVVGKEMYTTTPDPELGQIYTVTGVVSYGFEEYNIQPRFAADVETTVGVNEIGVLNTVNVFPNPATDNITLTLGEAAGQRVEYTLTDALGRSVIAGVVRDERIALNVQGLNNGVYHLTLRTAEFVRSVQVQVVR